MIYIGIDSSLSCTAVGVITLDGAGKPKLLSYGKIPTEPSMVYTERCIKIATEVKKIIGPYIDKNKSLLVGMETPNSFRGGDVTRKLCGLYGILLYVLKQDLGLDTREVNTMHAKKVTTGVGSADKGKIVKKVNSLFGLDLRYSKNKAKSDDDVADAISIAYCMMKDDSVRKKSAKKSAVIKKRRKRG